MRRKIADALDFLSGFTEIFKYKQEFKPQKNKPWDDHFRSRNRYNTFPLWIFLVVGTFFSFIRATLFYFIWNAAASAWGWIHIDFWQALFLIFVFDLFFSGSYEIK